MVSRLLTTLSGILSPNSSLALRNLDGEVDEQNDNNKKEKDRATADAIDSYIKSEIPMDRNTSTNMSNYDMHFINAESLDSAIVNKLQSRGITSVVDALEMKPPATGVKTRCEQGRKTKFNLGKSTKQNNAESIKEKKDELPADDLIDIEEVTTKTSSLEATRLRPRSMTLVLVKESLSKSGVMSHNISSGGTSEADSVISSVSDSEQSEELNAAGKRDVMYRNSRFNIENSSKEALCSDSNKLLPEDNIHSNTLLQLPIFGIPDPSLHRSRASFVSPSAESIHKSERRKKRESPVGKTRRNKALSPSPDHSFNVSGRISASQIGDHFFESTINDIIDKGGDEFRNKYSSWIWDAFRAQLVKLKSLMVAEFNEKLNVALGEREREVSVLQTRYREKLQEIDTSTDSFHKLMDNMSKENQRMLSAKDFVIEKLKKEFVECKKHFEQDLQRQMHSFRKEAEMESMELQKRNDELMLIMLTDGSKSGVEDAFKNEIDSLQKMIKTLTTSNELLRQQLEEATTGTTQGSWRTVENLEYQLQEATEERMELQKKLQDVETEKEDITAGYNEEIATLNRKLQELSTRYDHQLRDAAEELAFVRKKHSREIRECKNKLANQENRHKQVLTQVRQEYGGEVESLAQSVSQLQTELTVRGASRRLSNATLRT